MKNNNLSCYNIENHRFSVSIDPDIYQRDQIVNRKSEIVNQSYDLSLNRYKEVVHAEVAHRPPGEILKALGQLEAEIQQGMKELEGMLK